MKYPRQHKIYTGHLDLGSVASLFFLLLLFILLKSSFVFTPGLRVALSSTDPEFEQSVVRLSAGGDGGRITFRDRVYTLAEFETLLRSQANRPNAQRPRRVEIGFNIREDLVKRLQALNEELSLGMRFVKPDIELPLVENLPGVTNQTLVVAVAQNEQIFFDNQVTRYERFQAQLKAAKAKTAGPLTLVIEADQDVRLAVVMRLSMMAREAGITDVLIGGRPKVEPLSTGFF